MSNLQFSDEAWEEFCHWLGEDKKTLKRILKLLDDMKRNGYGYTTIKLYL